MCASLLSPLPCLFTPRSRRHPTERGRGSRRRAAQGPPQPGAGYDAVHCWLSTRFRAPACDADRSARWRSHAWSQPRRLSRVCPKCSEKVSGADAGRTWAPTSRCRADWHGRQADSRAAGRQDGAMGKHRHAGRCRRAPGLSRLRAARHDAAPRHRQGRNGARLQRDIEHRSGARKRALARFPAQAQHRFPGSRRQD